MISVDGDKEQANRVAILQDRMRKWFAEQTDLQDLAHRVKGQINAMGTRRARDILNALATTGHVEENYIKAWTYLRNRHVHQTLKDLKKPDQADHQKLVDNIHCVEVLLRQLTFNLIGYEGPYTDYGVRGDHGFPSRQYPMKVA